jgi:hypothetical protein
MVCSSNPGYCTSTLLVESSSDLFLTEDPTIFNFSVLLCYNLAAQKQQGIKMLRAVIFTTATVL